MVVAAQLTFTDVDVLVCKLSRQYPEAIVADFGCGEARLAESVPNKVHSFDLVACKPHVTACNIATVS